MGRENIPDCAAETFNQYFISPNIFESSEKPKNETNCCVVICKRIAPNVFDIRKGVAVVNETKNLFNDEICMIQAATKVIFE